MKRFHLHVGVKNLEDSIQFYSTLFGQPPVKREPDYAKWMLDDPSVNFAISTRANTNGVDHLGIQVENESELSEVTDRLRSAGLKLFDEGETTCCYSRSTKAWVTDPSGLAWETYRNMADAKVFSEAKERESACCAPAAAAEKKSCC